MSKSWAWLLLCLSSIACVQSTVIPLSQCAVHAGDSRACAKPDLNESGWKHSAIDNGLPFGIVPGTAFSESMGRLAPGEQPTFLSGGVVEAQPPTGELFGFDRTREISTQSALSIAHTAQRFGQEDDITALTLQFAPAEVLHA